MINSFREELGKKTIMKKYFLIGLICTICNSVFSQSTFKKLKVVNSYAYKIKNEGQIDLINAFDNHYDTVRSEVIFQNEPKLILQYCKSTLRNDTFFINIFNRGISLGNHSCTLKISNNTYSIDYTYYTVLDEPSLSRMFKVLKSELIVNTSSIKHGDIIRGKVQFEGRCIEGCGSEKNPKPTLLSGNFAVQVK